MSAVMVYKLGLDGRVTWQYEGRVLHRDANQVTLEAFFNREDAPFMGILLKRGDRFVETFYSDRWYNIFEIYDRDDGGLKGWYCNVGKPATIADGSVSYVDLALDLWVAADGAQAVLDEDEFEALGLDEATREMALRGLEELKNWVSREFY
jgi:predicted RNA-binding protein associated with RNAse of E/G family